MTQLMQKVLKSRRKLKLYTFESWHIQAYTTKDIKKVTFNIYKSQNLIILRKK